MEGSSFLYTCGLLSLLLSSSKSSSCEWSAGNATYDLHPLTLTSGGQSKYYTVHDSEADEGNSAKNFTYNFNICDKVLSYPSSECQNDIDDGYCLDSCIKNDSCMTSNDASCQVAITNKAYAYQSRINENGEKICHHIGSDVSNDFQFSLLDSSDPSAGVVLSYYNGDFCDNHGRNREFHIHFECENDAFNIPDNERVDEVETCVYNMTIKSIYGCPSQCGVYSHSLCGSQGLCGYDWTNNKAKCFCYHKYSGNDCSQYSDDTVSVDTKTAPTASKWVKTFKYETELSNAGGKKYNASVNVTYDLSEFYLSDDVFLVNDADSSNFEYYFNVLANIKSNLLPNACKNATDSCDFDSNPDCSDLGTVNSVGSAFQFNNGTGVCNLVGTVDTTSDYTWSLRDEEDPAKGVVLSYIDGGYCSSSNTNRKFTMTFECPDSTRGYYSPDQETIFSEYVDESHECEYDITITSALACPYECITDARDNKTNAIIENKFTVCSGKGICAADPSAKIVRCLCDDGWTGSDCNTVDESKNTSIFDNHTGFQIAIAIISIVLIALIGILVYMRMKYNSLQKNLQRQLLGEEEEEDDGNQGTQMVGTTVVSNKDGIVGDDSASDDDHSDAGIGDATNDNQLQLTTDGDNHDIDNNTNNNDTNDKNELVVENLDDAESE